MNKFKNKLSMQIHNFVYLWKQKVRQPQIIIAYWIYGFTEHRYFNFSSCEDKYPQAPGYVVSKHDLQDLDKMREFKLVDIYVLKI